MFEFIFRQVTLNKPRPCDKFNLFRIVTVKNTISRWYDKCKDTVTENIGDSLSSSNLDQDCFIL